MFKVRLVFNKEVIQTVYAVQKLENGLTQFLTFNDLSHKWTWIPASEYEPVGE
jgi:hypothetical protein